ncbi:MAG: hypothetical protein KTR13_01120 [Saprospiraceae bacterium]|nr:hypothetical protein [Saprospiraceae bacterium]
MKYVTLLLLSTCCLFGFGQNTLETKYKATYSIQGKQEFSIYFDKACDTFYLDKLPFPVERGMYVEQVLVHIPSSKIYGHMNFRGMNMYVELGEDFLQEFRMMGAFDLDADVSMNFVKNKETQAYEDLNCTPYDIYPDGEENDALSMCFDENKPYPMARLFGFLFNGLIPGSLDEKELPKGVVSGLSDPNSGELLISLTDFGKDPKEIEYAIYIKAN